MLGSISEEGARIWSNTEWQSEQHRVASGCWKLLQIPNNTVKCQLGSQLAKPWLPHLDQMRKQLFLQAGWPQGPLPMRCLRVRRRRGRYLYTWTGGKWPPSCRSHLFKKAGGEPGRDAVLPFRVFPSGIGREGDSSHSGSPEYIALLELKASFCSNFFHIILINQHKESCKISSTL